MALARQDYGSKNGAKAGSTAVPGTYGNGGSSYTIPGGAPSYLRSNYDMSGSKSVTDWSSKSGIAPSNVKVTDTRNFSYTPSNNTPSGGGGNGGGGGGGGGYSAPSYSGGTDDIINQIKALLNEQKAQADKYYQTLYEQQIAQNKQAWEDNRNQINRNYMRGSRYLQNMYGDSISGQGLSNMARNYQNWQSNLANNRQNYTNNDATALSQLNMNKANTASTLAQGWYNYVLPVYTNRQQTLDDYDYRRYLASL